MAEVIKKELTPRFVVPADQPAKYANRVIIQKTGPDEFVLSIFEERQPIIIGTDDLKRQLFDEVDRVDVVCVGRFVMPGYRIVELHELLERYVRDQKLEQLQGEGVADERED